MRDNHNRRNRFRTGGRSFRRNGSPNNHINRTGLTSFDRSRSNLRGNQNPSRLLEKYSNLAKEALSSGDKILSENYLQHAEHFSRILSGRNSNVKNNFEDKEQTQDQQGKDDFKADLKEEE